MNLKSKKLKKCKLCKEDYEEKKECYINGIICCKNCFEGLDHKYKIKRRKENRLK